MKKKLLPKRLKHYAALAASAIASEASSQVVYTNMADTTLVNNGDFFDISLNNDGVMEVRLSISKYTSTNGPIYVRRSSAGAEALNFADINMTMVSTSYGTYSAAVGFSLNDTISSNANIWSNGSAYVGGYAYITYQTNVYTGSIGQFPGAGDKYLGVQFLVGANLHYGWVRLDLSSNSDSLTIKDYAYESSPNTQILAGERGAPVGIEDVDSKQFDFYSNGNEIIFKNLEKPSTLLTIYDLSGKIIETAELSLSQNSFVLSRSLEGIYIVELRNRDGVSRKKLWLDSK